MTKYSLSTSNLGQAAAGRLLAPVSGTEVSLFPSFGALDFFGPPDSFQAADSSSGDAILFRNLGQTHSRKSVFDYRGTVDIQRSTTDSPAFQFRPTHSSFDSLDKLGIYSHVVGNSQRDAVEKLAAILRPNAPKLKPDDEWIQ